MRAKILEMIGLVVGPFDKMIESIAIDGMEDVPPEDIPPTIRDLHAFVKQKLGENRLAYEDAIVAVIAPHFTESDLDTIIAFNNSEAGQKMKALLPTLQPQLEEALAKWRNDTLEPHVEEFKRIAGVEEPGPALDTEAKPAQELELTNDPLPPIDLPDVG